MIICHFCPRTSRRDEDAAGLGEVSEKIHELLLVSQSLPDVTAAIRELTDLAASQKVIVSAQQLQTIRQGFCCVVCKSKYAEILVSVVFVVDQNVSTLVSFWSLLVVL